MKTNSIGKSFTIEKILKIDVQKIDGRETRIS